MSSARIEPCACGGSIIANADSPGPAVLAHNRTAHHQTWRLREDAYDDPGPEVYVVVPGRLEGFGSRERMGRR